MGPTSGTGPTSNAGRASAGSQFAAVCGWGRGGESARGRPPAPVGPPPAVKASRTRRVSLAPRRGVKGYTGGATASVRWPWEGGWMSISWSERARSRAASASSGSSRSTTSTAATPCFPSRSSESQRPGAAPTSGTGLTSSAGSRPGGHCLAPPLRRTRRRSRDHWLLRFPALRMICASGHGDGEVGDRLQSESSSPGMTRPSATTPGSTYSRSLLRGPS